jgi:hypothetical protein
VACGGRATRMSKGRCIVFLVRRPCEFPVMLNDASGQSVRAHRPHDKLGRKY